MNTIKRISIIKEKFMPLYEGLLQSVANINYDKCIFFPQWGTDFPLNEEHKGIMVMGRACNGWHSKSQDINVLFGNSDESIFNRKDQIKWVKDSAGNKEGYNTNRSAFWRVTKQIAQSFYPNKWHSYIAWSNVCKVAPWIGGNPNDTLYNAQLEWCKKILEAEIKLLSPKVVVMFTGHEWAIDFLRFLNYNQNPQNIKCLSWDKYNNYTCEVYYIKNTYFLVTKHPQGKKEKSHVECITDFIENLTN